MLNQKQLNLALLVFSALLFASVVFPLHYHPYRTFFQDGLGIASVIFCLGSMASSASFTLRIPNSVIIPFALIAVIGVQTWNGFILYPLDMVYPVIYLVCLALAMTCGATLAMQEDGLHNLSCKFAWTLIAFGLLSVFLQHVQLINLNWTPFLDPLNFAAAVRPYANVAQPNLLALLLCFSLASIWYVYLQYRIRPLPACIMAIFLLWGLALTQSRATWIIVPLLLIFCWHQPSGQAKFSKPLGVLLLVIFVGLIFLVPVVLTWLGIPVDDLQTHAGKTSVRLILWQQALQMSLTHPWFGVGWYQFGPQQVMTASQFAPTEYSEMAHNIVLNFAAEIGWPLTALLGVGVAFWIYWCVIKQWHNLPVRYFSLILIAIGVHSMVEFPLWHGFILMPFGVIVGALHVQRLGWEQISCSRIWVIAAVIGSVIVSTALTLDYIRVYDGFTALQWTQEGKTSGVGSIEKPRYTLFPQFYDYFHLVKVEVGAGMPAKDLQLLERQALRFGFTPILGRLALASANNGRPTEALSALLVVRQLNGADYPKVYHDWDGFAQRYPALYAEIFRRLPKPESASSTDLPGRPR